MKIFKLFFTILLVIAVSCAPISRKGMPELQVVPYVNIERYLGKWYEIARYPHGFEENCYGAQAEYFFRENQTIGVTNRCWLGGFDGELDEVSGKAWITDKKTNAKLKVSFFWPFSGDYWIIHLDSNYQYAIVGHPSRKYLWILNRSPKIKTEIYQILIQKVKDAGYDLSQIIKAYL